MAKLEIIKRDGRSTEFDLSKITEAIVRAFSDVRQKEPSADEIGYIDKLASKVQMKSEIKYNCRFASVEDIQDLVVQELMKSKLKDVAEGYIKYRQEKEFIRDRSMDVETQVKRVFKKDDKEVVSENANKDSRTFGTQRDYMAGMVAKSVALKDILPEKVSNAHMKGDIHFHDLDYSPFMPFTNCCLIDFKTMFEKGFKIGNAQVASPNSINTATAQTAQIIANVASSQYGGCTFDRADEVLGKYARNNLRKHFVEDLIDYCDLFEDEALSIIEDLGEGFYENEPCISLVDLRYIHMVDDILDCYEVAIKRTKKDILDAMQSLEYEINTLYSSQGQTPFTSVGFGMGVKFLEREVQKAILRVRIAGLGEDKKTAIFPKLIFGLRRGVNLEATDPNYDIKQLALECSSKRMYPDVLMYDKLVELTGSYKAPMGCRSFLQGWKDKNGQEVNAGRMNLGVVTMNLPRIAIESKGDIEKFWRIFNERLRVAKEALMFRKESTFSAKPENAPILYKHGAFGHYLNDDEDVSKLFLNRRATLSLGYIGLYEVGTVFFGHDWENNSAAKNFTLSILEKMKKACQKWSDESDVHFSIYSTPSESLTDRFCRLDREKFGVINDITDKEYYTNSFHYDVRKNPTPFEKLDFEKDYPVFASGGFIHYCEYPVMTHNLKALEAVWDYGYDRVGYLGTNTPIDKCHECGFKGDFEPTAKGFKCPNCGNSNPESCDVVKRTCGYLGNPQARPMVKGRHKEISARVKHM